MKTLRLTIFSPVYRTLLLILQNFRDLAFELNFILIFGLKSLLAKICFFDLSNKYFKLPGFAGIKKSFSTHMAGLQRA